MVRLSPKRTAGWHECPEQYDKQTCRSTSYSFVLFLTHCSSIFPFFNSISFCSISLTCIYYHPLGFNFSLNFWLSHIMLLCWATLVLCFSRAMTSLFEQWKWVVQGILELLESFPNLSSFICLRCSFRWTLLVFLISFLSKSNRTPPPTVLTQTHKVRLSFFIYLCFINAYFFLFFLSSSRHVREGNDPDPDVLIHRHAGDPCATLVHTLKTRRFIVFCTK